LGVESSSRFGQSENQKFWRRLFEEGNRENGSTLSWLAHVFAQPGPIPAVRNTRRDRLSWVESRRSRFARPMMPMLKKRSFTLPEAMTPDTAPISTLPLVAQRAEVYRRV
jgi:hypothetical protein